MACVAVPNVASKAKILKGFPGEPCFVLASVYAHEHTFPEVLLRKQIVEQHYISQLEVAENTWPRCESARVWTETTETKVRSATGRDLVILTELGSLYLSLLFC